MSYLYGSPNLSLHAFKEDRPLEDRDSQCLRPRPHHLFKLIIGVNAIPELKV